MTGFRSEGGQGAKAGRFSHTATTATSPFTQVQILHLMKTEFARARRHGFPLSCLLVQIDRLQPLVDLHGAELRQTIRVQLSRLVREKTRGHDHLGLTSKDGLVVVLPHTDETQAIAVADRIRDEFRRLEVKVGGNVLPLTLSLGVAACTDQQTLFFDTMLAQAEVALEWAMEAGGDRVQAFAKDRFVDT